MNIQPTHDPDDQIFERYAVPGSAGCAVAGTRVRNLRFDRQLPAAGAGGRPALNE